MNLNLTGTAFADASFLEPRVPYLQPRDFGAVGNGTTDDTAALQALLDAVPEYGQEVRLPAGRFRLTAPLTLRAKHGLRLSGAGPWATRLEWAGAAGEAMLALEACSHVGVSDLGFRSVDVVAGAAIRVSNGDPANPSINRSMFHRFERLFIDGHDPAAPKFARGIEFLPPDANNDKCVFSQVWIQCCTSAGVFLGHSQCKAHTFDGCAITRANRGVETTNGSFTWRGGVMSWNADADFVVGAQTDPILISGLNSENSNRLLRSQETMISITMPITIEGCRWTTGQLAADGYAVDVKMYGPLTLLGNRFGTEPANPKVRLVTPAGNTAFADKHAASVVAIGNDFVSTKAHGEVTADDLFHRYEVFTRTQFGSLVAQGNTVNYRGIGGERYGRVPNVVVG